eukprot:6186846-Pleurochrysis_carterae.AAC.2
MSAPSGVGCKGVLAGNPAQREAHHRLRNAQRGLAATKTHCCAQHLPPTCSRRTYSAAERLPYLAHDGLSSL